jgi:hypothetical protein
MKLRASLYLVLLVFLFVGKSVLIGQCWELNTSGEFVKPGDNEIVFTPQGEEGGSKLSWGIQQDSTLVALGGQVVWTDQDGKEAVPLLEQKTVDLENGIVQAIFSFNDLSIDLKIQLEATQQGILMTVFCDEPLPSTLRNEMALRLSLKPASFLETAFSADQIAGVFPLYPSPEYSVWPDGRQWLLPLAGGRSFTFVGKKYTLGIKALAGGLSLEDRRESWSAGFFNLFTLLPIGKTGKLAEWEIEVSSTRSEIMSDDILFVQTGYHARQAKFAILPDGERRQVYAKLLKMNIGGEFSPVFTGPVIAVNTLGRQQLRFDFSPIQEEGLYVIQYGEQHSKPIIISEWVYEQLGKNLLSEWLAQNAKMAIGHATGEEQHQEQGTLDWNEIEPNFDRHIEVLSSTYAELSKKDQNTFRRLAARWSKEHSQQGGHLSLIPPMEVNYEVLLSNALNCWFLHQVFPELVDVGLVFSSLDYIHGLHADGGRSLVAGVGQQSCYLNDNLPMPVKGSFWQAPQLTNKEDFDSKSNLLMGSYLQLLYVARNSLNPREKRKGY